MGKMSRAAAIRRLFDTLRSTVDINTIYTELDIVRLKEWEDFEKRLIEKNTDIAVEEAEEFVKLHYRKIYKLKSFGKRFEVLNGKIIKVTNLK